MYKKALIFLSILSLFMNCNYYLFLPKHIKKGIKYCYNDLYTGLDSLIDINGYYYPISDNINEYPLSPVYIFYGKGFVYVNPYFEYLIRDKFKNIWFSDVGNYVLYGDTIRIQYITPPGGMSRGIVEIWFKIVNRTTLLKIYQGSGEEVNPDSLPPLNSYLDKKFVLHSKDIRNNPNKSWIIKRKWFWCDKQAYKKWKNKQRQLRKKQK